MVGHRRVRGLGRCVEIGWRTACKVEATTGRCRPYPVVVLGVVERSPDGGFGGLPGTLGPGVPYMLSNSESV